MSATTNETVNTTAAAPKVDDAKATGGAAKTDAAPGGEEKPVVVKPELKGHRIHIGNLPFKATEEDVRALVAKAKVEILEVTIPQRTGRPAGYAFVAFNTEEDSKKAMEALADEEIEGRKIKLQAARSPEEQAERRAEVAEQRKAEKKAEKAEKAKAAAEKKAAEGGDAAEAGGAVEGETKPKKKRSSKKGPRRRIPGQEDKEAEGEATETADGAAAADDAEVKTAKPKKKKSSKSRKAREARIDGGATEGEEAAPSAEGAAEAGETRKPREKKAKKPRQVPTGQPSATTVFVANLPFEVDDAKLAEIFTNLSIRVTSAKVVTGVRRNREGRSFRGSRGFGFVEVEDPAQQKEAVEKVEGSLIGDRTLSAKIANEMKTVEEEEVKEAVKEEEGVKKEEGAGSPAQVSSSAN